jgi:SagB-type dehydrogenase family enzyme
MDPGAERDVVRAYHEETKHFLHRYADGPGELDWANQPDPFRRWRGSPLVPLVRDFAGQDVLFRDALEEGVLPAVPLDAAAVARLFYDSLALSAWKAFGRSRWSLRVNPSSGNLHPTEAHLLAPAVPGLATHPGVWHYAPREHGLELRAALPAGLWAELARGFPAGSFFLGLSSIPWREAWKYGERALRYCHHDLGHALACVAYAAAGLGWRAELVDELAEEELSALLGTAGQDWPERELADALLWIDPAPAPGRRRRAGLPELAPAFRALEWRGEPSRLSPEHVRWPGLERCAAAIAAPRREPRPPPRPALRTGTASAAPAAAAPDAGLRAIVRARRSAVALDGRSGLAREAFLEQLRATMPRPGRVPFAAAPWPPRVALAVFVHRVAGLEPGLYLLARAAGQRSELRACLRPEFLWQPVEEQGLELDLLLPADLRGSAAHIACLQDIAGDGAYSLGMLARFAQPIREEGAWVYPRLFWECGAVGQALYLGAEAAGVRATGIGCFFDDAMHALLGLRDDSWQSLYHFTVGTAVEDARLSTLPAYG